MREAAWRLGHASDPLGFVPRPLCGWQHRWDDPRRVYRTLYTAETSLTCLREVLADLRPNAKVLAELRELFGPEAPAARDAGAVTVAFRSVRVLAPAWAVGDEAWARIDDDLTLRRGLEQELSGLLVAHDMPFLDTTELRSRDRIVTQAISRRIHDRGFAGIVFGSLLDSGRCWALFEGRAALEPRGDLVRLDDDLPELVQVCAEFGLAIKVD